MENSNQISPEDALKHMAISQAASSYQWPEAIPADVRPIIVEAKVKKQLESLGAQLQVVNGEVELHRKDKPGLPYYESDRKLSVQEVVNRALGIQQAVSKKDGPYYQRLSDDQYIKGGITHTKVGNQTYIDPIEKRMATQQGSVDYGKAKSAGDVTRLHVEQLNKELGINP